jgi:hypothetical protein
MIKRISSIVNTKPVVPVVLPTVKINEVGSVKYIGQSGTCGYASAAKG